MSDIGRPTSRSDCSDKAAVESFFSRVKSERVDRKTYRSRDEARANVFVRDHIETFYNPRCRQSTRLSFSVHESKAVIDLVFEIKTTMQRRAIMFFIETPHPLLQEL